MADRPSGKPIWMRRLDGLMTHDVKEKLDLFERYYGALYSSMMVKETELTNFFRKVHIKQLSDDDCNYMEEPIQLEEISEASKCLKLNKSPGNDGFTGEFYKKFQAQLVKPLQSLFSDP